MALTLIDIIYEKGLINEATFRNIQRKYAIKEVA